jgi:N-acetylmuramoyl-L-alanine amidase
VDLTQGYHVIRLEYFQDRYNAVINLTWNPPAGQNPAQPAYGAQLPAPVSSVNGTVSFASALNVRSGPGVNYDILTQLRRNDTFSVLGRNSDASWAHVRASNNLDGWLSVYYVSISGDIFSVPIEAAPPPPPPQATGVRGELLSGLRVRSGPSISYPEIAELDWGTVVDIIGRSSNGTYYQIQYAGITGWIYAPYVEVVSGIISNVPITG